MRRLPTRRKSWIYLCRAFPEFARARNARLVMSNAIPEMSVPSSIPYCIWYPDVATEDTYRELARKYPDMRYHVGRACAVAGYTELYRELNLLPDISIAEEARENTNNGHDIFLDIVQASTRYAVMDDYTRTVNLVNPRAGMFLNGDTAVCSSLSLTDSFDSVQSHYSKFDLRDHLDITEDRGVGEHEVGPIPPPLREDEVQWLYKPLPRDLPLVNKDLLILMAAYEGNVDRYARLRRPHFRMIDAEYLCIIRGIYHHTTFAKWWAEELKNDQVERRIGPTCRVIWTAIIARFIMCNDLSLAMTAKKYYLPYLIWYPLRPRPETLAELVRRRPEMLLPVAHACIAADYQNVYDELDVTPHPALLEEAKNSGNPYYLSHLESRSGKNRPTNERTRAWGQQQDNATQDKEPTSSWLYGSFSSDMFSDGMPGGIYGGCQGNSCYIDLFLCSPVELRRKAAKEEGGWRMLYLDSWPDIPSEDENDG